MCDVQPDHFEDSTLFHKRVFIPVTLEYYRYEDDEININRAAVGADVPLTPEQIQAIHQDVCDELAGF